MKKIVGVVLFCLALASCNEMNKAKVDQTANEIKNEVVEVAKTDITKELEAFPKTMDGFDRYVIALGSYADESEMKVELIPGKTMEVDCNKHFMMGNMTDVNVEGYGYTYYKFESNGNVNSTMMACPDNKLTKQFVQGASCTINYNSKLPVVVFVPKGCELKYRILQPEEMRSATME